MTSFALTLATYGLKLVNPKNSSGPEGSSFLVLIVILQYLWVFAQLDNLYLFDGN